LIKPEKKPEKGQKKVLIFIFGVGIIVTRSQLKEVVIFSWC